MGMCALWDRGLCHSCGWIDQPYATQLERKRASLESLLGCERVDVCASATEGFRYKAKMVVSDTPLSVGGVLKECPLYTPVMRELLQELEWWLRDLGIRAYDGRKGELKYLLVTQSYAHDTFMVRFVLRSHGIVARLRRALPMLLERCPAIEVASVNIQPIHMARLEGEEEILLTEKGFLEDRLNGIDFLIAPKSFFQTNPAIAEALYRSAASWVRGGRVSDLFCGVGGFALHVRDGEVYGVEIVAEAIHSAQESADRLGYAHHRFEAVDVGEIADRLRAFSPSSVIVNPPRRGLGEGVCAMLSELAPEQILYSSCNPQTLVSDCKRLRGYRVARVKMFDMFAHTEHAEVLVELCRIDVG